MLWSLLCRSSTTIVHIIHIVFRRVVCLLGVIYDFSFPRKLPSEDKKRRFPFLKLHYVAIREVLNTLDPIDYINFSKTSKSCRHLSTIKKPYKVKLVFAEFPLIRFRNGNPIEYIVRWTANRQEDGTREFWEYESFDNLYKYSENSLDALKEFKEFYLYVKSLMSVEIDSVAWFMSNFNELCGKDVDWLRSNVPEFPALFIHGLNQLSFKVQYILDNVKVTKSLEIYVSLFESIEKPLPLRIPGTIKELRIVYGSWITLDYIISLKIRRLSFRNTYLTNEDMNVFFKSWIEMKSHHNLERFEINVSDREDFITSGLRDIPYQKKPMRPGPSPRYVSVLGSFEVTRDDGLTASICTYLFVSGFIVVMYTRLSDLN